MSMFDFIREMFAERLKKCDPDVASSPKAQDVLRDAAWKHLFKEHQQAEKVFVEKGQQVFTRLKEVARQLEREEPSTKEEMEEFLLGGVSNSLWSIRLHYEAMAEAREKLEVIESVVKKAASTAETAWARETLAELGCVQMGKEKSWFYKWRDRAGKAQREEVASAQPSARNVRVTRELITGLARKALDV